jgi:hypothetical protein
VSRTMFMALISIPARMTRPSDTSPSIRVQIAKTAPMATATTQKVIPAVPLGTLARLVRVGRYMLCCAQQYCEVEDEPSQPLAFQQAPGPSDRKQDKADDAEGALYGAT